MAEHPWRALQEVLMLAHEQSVLIVHPDPKLREGLVAALAPRQIIAVSSRDDAARTMAERVPDVVLADALEARRFIKDLDRLAPRAMRVFLCPRSQADAMRELVDAAAEGHEFHTVDPTLSVDEVARSLRELLRQRGSTRVPAVGLEASFYVDGEQLRAGCLDVGNEGFLLKLPVDAPIERLPPGTRLFDFRLEREGRVVLRTGGGFVRHIGLERAPGEAYFRVGVQIERAGASIGYVELATIDDMVRVVAVLRRALRRQPTLQCALVQGVRRREDLAATLVENGEGFRPVLRCAKPQQWSVAVGDVVQLVFDLSGKSYRGWASVLRLEPDAFVLSLPRNLALYHRRSSMRFRAGEDQPFAISFVSPLTGERIEHPVMDLHAVGLAFAYDAAREVLPVGLIIDDVSLVLPDGTRAPCHAEVRDNAPLLDHTPGDLARPFRCGMRLLNVLPEARQAVINAFVQASCPQVRDGRSEPFRNIWGLVQAVHLFHPDYPFEEGPHMEVLEDTHHKLATVNEGLARTFVYYDGPKLIGHVSGVRTHSRTWMMQHLMVLPTVRRGESISRDLSALCVDYAEALEDLQYLRIYWRIQNKWPDRVFGWIARSMHREGLTDLRTLNYTRLAFTQPLRARKELPQVRRATAADLQWLEGHIRARGDVVQLLADDLMAREAELPTLASRYGAHGLKRGRSLFVVDGDDAPIAMALAEEASPGLSWPEMTSAFSYVVPDPLHPRAPEAREALAVRCVDHYREQGKGSALALVQDDEVESLVSLGFRWHCRVAQWTGHRSVTRTWHMLMAAVFERLQDRAARHMGRNEEQAA
ncbi:PilZ domain-containing protein [Hyalangium rubrum]|uniref:PilZ domain-containing protein n=1 Tax=Hyalangium rubrum TaxID=3103134 RepID=A0ABU5GWQ3_9BACT|nr:PilZ domain-containing protein [Hyalangium sp. s54d21]MDY7225279.1 PilZ domain-containing protein [Hyalangium sp. s54d21]